MSHIDPRSRSLSADRLRSALHEVGGAARPVYLDDIVTQARHTPQRPAWTFPERWLPMSIAVRRAGFPRAAVLLSLFLLVVTLLAVAVAVVGTPRTPAPFVVTNGLLVFESGGDIVGVRPDGTERRTLVDLPGTIGPMALSSDGRRLAYWAQNGETWDLIVGKEDGTDPTTIVSGALDPSEPSWSPDATQVVYADRTVPGDTPGSSRIFVAAVDGSGARQIGDPALEVRPPAWSPDGTSIAFGGDPSLTGVFRLYLMDADGTNVRQVSDVVGEGFAFIRIDWSRDGSKVVAQASDANSLAEWDIWIIDATDGTATDVGAHIGGDEIMPSWAPDRDALAWAHATIVLLEDGAEPVDLPTSGIPVWSPDGRSLATANEAGDLVILDLSGVVLATIPGVSSLPIWQPDLSDD